MSFQPFDRKPSGIVFFGTNATDQVFESDANFTIDGTYLSASNVKIANGGTIGSVGDVDAISIASNGDVTFSQDISVVGNLTVNGTTTTVNSTVVAIEDPIIILGSGSPSTDDNKDRGISFNYYSGSAKKGFFGFDDSSGKFTFVPDATITGEVVSGTAGTIVADLEGNADTATTLETGRNFSMTGEVTASAISFNGGANVQLNGVLSPTAISNQSAITSVDGTNDYLLIWDATDSELKKVTRANFVSGLGSMSNFIITDGTTSQTIDDGETVTFADGTGAEFVVSATNTVTVNSVDSEIVHDNLSGFVANEHVDHSTVTLTAGDGLTGGGTIAASRTFAVGAGTLIDVTADAVNVDLSEASEAAIANGDYLLFLDGGATGTAAKESFADFVAFMAGNGLASSSSVLNIGAGAGITVDANEVKVTKGSGVNVDSNGVHVALVSYAAQAVAANAASSTASRTYPIQVDGNNDLVVNVPWTDESSLTTEEVQDIVGAMVTGNTETLITVTYQDADGTIDFVVDNNLANYSNASSNFFDVAGDGLTSTGSTVNVVAGTLIDVTADAVNVDLSEASEAAIANGDYILFLDGGSSGTAAKESLADLVTLLAGAGMTATNSVLNVIGGDGITANANEIEVTVDNSTIELSASTGSGAVRVKAGGIDTAQLANGAVTEAKRERSVASVTTTSTLSSDINLCAGGAGGITVTLPAVATGKIITIKKTDSSAGVVTVQRGGTSTIDGGTTTVLYHQYESVTLASDGTNWYII